jgi:hypothetical protein
MQIFMQNPILGIGYGRNRSFEITTTLLSNIGLLGFVTFVMLIGASLRMTNLIPLMTKDKLLISVSYGLKYSLMLSLFAMLIAIPDLTFMYFWLVLSLISSVYNLARKTA